MTGPALELDTFLRLWLRRHVVGHGMSADAVRESLVACGPLVSTLIGELAMAMVEEELADGVVAFPEDLKRDTAFLEAREIKALWSDELVGSAQRFIRQFPRSKRP